MGGNNNMSGTFNVDFYRAYNDCGGTTDRLGAEIKVAFQPTAGSLIQDVMWVSAYRERWPGTDNSRMDDNSRLPAGQRPGTVGGPFYPFQDEDNDAAGGWQSGYQYDYFYDKPGDPCPAPGTTTSLSFETYAVWWDDTFNADGTITDVGSNGHHVFVHEGFRWGYDLTCVPAPSTLIALAGGLLAMRRRRGE